MMSNMLDTLRSNEQQIADLQERVEMLTAELEKERDGLTKEEMETSMRLTHNLAMSLIAERDGLTAAINAWVDAVLALDGDSLGRDSLAWDLAADDRDKAENALFAAVGRKYDLTVEEEE